MISSVLQFGSYVRQTNVSKLFEDTEGSATSCVITPNWQQLELLQGQKYNYNTSIFRFRLPNHETHLRLPLGGFMLVLAKEKEVDGSDAIRPYTVINDDSLGLEYFEILVKRYDEWGVKEDPKSNNFLFTKTDHSYKPKGIVSNYIHSLRVGDLVSFKHSSICVGKLNCLLGTIITGVTFIAVGVGIAPYINTLRYLLTNDSGSITKIALLYGVREVQDILMRELLEEWRIQFADRFTIVYCVGSRYDNVYFAAKTNKPIAPPKPKDFESLPTPREIGWINEEKVKKYAIEPSSFTRVLVCGLPGIYRKLCGYRDSPEIEKGSVLSNLSYTSEMVIKL